jgi:ribosomal protein S18 acetylase RimI-like enzyme
MGSDLVTMAQCIVLDVGAFPYPSIPFDIGHRNALARIWVARDALGRVIGFVALLTRRDIEIVGLAVDGAERRRGVGRSLLRRAMTASDTASPIVLHVSTSNSAAIGLYRSEGFVVRRRLVDYYSRGVYPDRGDALEMVWSAPAGDGRA